MKSSTPKTEPPPSTQLRKAVFGGAQFIAPILTVALALSVSAWAADPAPKLDPEKLFKRLDTNSDSNLSKEEFKKLAELGQGKLKDQPEMVEKLFERLDADKDGSLKLEEFKKLAAPRGRSGPPSSPAPKAAPRKTNAAGQVTRPESDDPWALVRGQLDGKVNDGILKGVGLVVYDSSGTLVFEHDTGDFSNDRWVPILSSTKWVTAAVIYTLIRDGLLKLTTTTGEVLGWKGAQGTVTVAQLLACKSGYSGLHQSLAPPPIIDQGGKIVTPGSNTVSITDCARRIYEDSRGADNKPVTQRFVAPENDVFSYTALHGVCSIITGDCY